MEVYEFDQLELAKRNPDAELTRDAFGALREVDTENGTAIFDISSKSLDLHRSCINTKGIDYQSRYFGEKGNPIVLFNHDYDKPIGKSRWVKLMDNGMMRSECVYGKTPLAREVLSLVKDEIIKAASISFVSKAQYFGTEAEQKYKEDYGEECPDGMEWYVRSCTMLEWSNVSIGSNGDALIARMGNMSPTLRHAIVVENVRKDMPALFADVKRIADEAARAVSESGAMSERLKNLEQKYADLETTIKAGAVQPKEVEQAGNKRLSEKDIETMFRSILAERINYFTGQV